MPLDDDRPPQHIGAFGQKRSPQAAKPACSKRASGDAVVGVADVVGSESPSVAEASSGSVPEAATPFRSTPPPGSRFIIHAVTARATTTARAPARISRRAVRGA